MFQRVLVLSRAWTVAMTSTFTESSNRRLSQEVEVSGRSISGHWACLQGKLLLQQQAPTPYFGDLLVLRPQCTLSCMWMIQYYTHAHCVLFRSAFSVFVLWTRAGWLHFRWSWTSSTPSLKYCGQKASHQTRSHYFNLGMKLVQTIEIPYPLQVCPWRLTASDQSRFQGCKNV